MYACNVCQNHNISQLYSSQSNKSITTMNTIIDGETELYFCQSCSHVQTKALFDIENYYENDYEINLKGLYHDQLYKISDGIEIFRNQHQATTISSKVDLFEGMRILDYGCGNGLTLKHLKEAHPTLEYYAFDVTEKYVDFWNTFLRKDQIAPISIPTKWESSMDLVVSFFALEHVADPGLFIADLSKYINDTGSIYLIVPNMYQNYADMLVADHINHFSELSLKQLLNQFGFDNVEVDTTSHDSALIIMAQKTKKTAKIYSNLPHQTEVDQVEKSAKKIANVWRDVIDSIENHFMSNKGVSNIIYGAGVYGTIIYQYLSEWGEVECFIDRNTFVQGVHVSGTEVLSPDDVDTTGKNIWFGVNPLISQSVATEFCKQRNMHSYYYLGKHQ